jgi:hypothetical protein
MRKYTMLQRVREKPHGWANQKAHNVGEKCMRVLRFKENKLRLPRF